MVNDEIAGAVWSAVASVARHRFPDLGATSASSELLAFMDALEEVGDRHSELFDTDVREQMWAVIERKYIQLDDAYEIPMTFGMFSEAGNSELRAVLVQHLANMVSAAEVYRLDSEGKRLASLQNPGVRSTQHGYTCDEFIGAP